MGKMTDLMTSAKVEAEKPETAHRWRVRWETPDGMYTFTEIHRAGSPMTRAEVEAWGEEQVRLLPKRYKRVAVCYTVPDGDV